MSLSLKTIGSSHRFECWNAGWPPRMGSGQSCWSLPAGPTRTGSGGWRADIERTCWYHWESWESSGLLIRPGPGLEWEERWTIIIKGGAVPSEKFQRNKQRNGWHSKLMAILRDRPRLKLRTMVSFVLYCAITYHYIHPRGGKRKTFKILRDHERE